MPVKRAIISLALIVIAVLPGPSCGGPPPETNGDRIVANEMLSSAMDYIKAKHPDAAPFIKENMKWTTGSTAKRPGYTGVTYAGSGWTVNVGHAITAEVIYEIRAEYPGEKIVWAGMIKDNIITEESYARE